MENRSLSAVRQATVIGLMKNETLPEGGSVSNRNMLEPISMF
jgi:hypothetical protein